MEGRRIRIVLPVSILTYV